MLPSDAIAVAAAWGVARMGDRKAEPLLVKLLGSSSPDVRALAAVGLGLTHDRKHVPALAALARTRGGQRHRARRGDARARRAGGRAPTPALLLANAGSSDVLLRQAALLTMARLGVQDDAGKTTGPAEAIAAGIFSPDDSLRAHRRARRHRAGDPRLPAHARAAAGARRAAHPARRARRARPRRPTARPSAPRRWWRWARRCARRPWRRWPLRRTARGWSPTPSSAAGGKLGLAPFTSAAETADGTRPSVNASAVDEVVESIAADRGARLRRAGAAPRRRGAHPRGRAARAPRRARGAGRRGRRARRSRRGRAPGRALGGGPGVERPG